LGASLTLHEILGAILSEELITHDLNGIDRGSQTKEAPSHKLEDSPEHGCCKKKKKEKKLT
jgi:hypothetical protein